MAFVIIDVLSDNPKSLLTAFTIAVTVGWHFLFHGAASNGQDDKEPPMVQGMSIFQFLPNAVGKRGPDFVLAVARAMNSFIYRVPVPSWGKNIVKVYVVADPVAARAILENPKHGKSPRFYKAFDKISTGETFFSRNGPRAMHVRKSTATAFSSQNIKRMSDIIETIMETWVAERLEPLYVQPDHPIDIDREMVLITTDVIFQVGFDYKLSVQDRDIFVGHIELALGEFFGTTNMLRDLRWTSWMFSGIRKARRTAKEMFQLTTKVLEAYRQNPNPDPNTLIHMLANDPDYESDEERIRDMVTFIFAGFDTTAHSIAWALLELARHPEEQQLLRSALIKNNSNCSSKEEARQCQELKNVIRETLRLYTPAALGSIRTLDTDVPLLGTKLIIPADSYCIMPFYVLLRNGTYFEDPDSFKPSRWNHPSEASLKAFMPFAVGSRNCPGQGLAHAEMTIVMARLLLGYEFTVEQQGKKEYMVTLRSIGTKLRVKALAK
jgi:cytochrome P450